MRPGWPWISVRSRGWSADVRCELLEAMRAYVMLRCEKQALRLPRPQTAFPCPVRYQAWQSSPRTRPPKGASAKLWLGTPVGALTSSPP